MSIQITDKAVQLYKQEMYLNSGDSLTLFVRVGGVGSGGFSAGIIKGKPDVPYQTFEIFSIIFCITEEDLWYFENMMIDYNEDMGEVQFVNHAIEDVINPNPNKK